jgi:hypothetical protein
MSLRLVVTLSDGTTAEVGLRQTFEEYYPDAPHCSVCDRRGVVLRQCQAPIGPRRWPLCGRYLCRQCRCEAVHASVRRKDR